MKLNFGKRFALILHWLGSVIALAALVFNARALELVQTVQNRIGEKYTHMALIALAAVYAFLCILALCILLRPSGKRSERGFITVDSSDTGRVRIAVSAIEQMVKQAVGAYVQVDLPAAAQVIARDDEVDACFARLAAEIAQAIAADPTGAETALDLFMIAKYLERLADHAVNVAEWVEFLRTGVHKSRRIV